MNESTDKISTAVEKCVAYARDFASPALANCEFIALLKPDST
jgi:hypothetical protein